MALKRKYQTSRETVLKTSVIDAVRAEARRYILAGGGIGLGHDDIDEHIGNVHEWLMPGDADKIEDSIDRAVPKDHPPADLHEAHETLWSDVHCHAANLSNAGFLFGVYVGFELAAQVGGQNVRMAKPRKAVRR